MKIITMSSTEEQVKNIISKHDGSVRKQQIARELNMGLDYVDLVCRDLERKGEIAFRNGYYLLTISKKASRQRIIPIKKSKPSSRRGKGSSEAKALRPPKRKKGAQNTFLGMPEMSKKLINILKKAGYKTIESLADAPIARFMQETKLELHEAAGLINQARKALNKIGE